MSRLREDVEGGGDRTKAWPGPAGRDEELASLARAVAHPVRAAILRHLQRRGSCTCGAIVDLFPHSQATVSQHLKVLKDAGLLLGEIDGPRICYCVNPEGVARLKRLVAGL